MEGGMKNIFFWILISTAIVAVYVTVFQFELIDRSLNEGVCTRWTIPFVCNDAQETHMSDEQSIPTWEREGHVPVTPALNPSQTERASSQTATVREQPRSQEPELVRASAPATDGGVDQWGRRYDALVQVPPGVPLCGAMRISRGFSRETPEAVIQSFINTVITRICSVPPDQRVFPEGEVCEPVENWRREACYTFRGTP